MISSRLLSESLPQKVFFLAAASVVAVTLIIFGFMATLAMPLFSKGHLVQILTQPWIPNRGYHGIAPMVIGTLLISIPAVVVAFPMSMGVSALISVISPKGFGRLLKKLVHLMTGIPTVIYGFIGVFLLVPLIRHLSEGRGGFCILSASLLLSVLISPTMILVFTESFERVPAAFMEAADALGANRTQKLLFIVLPSAWRGVLSGLILALGRAIGDTLISLMVAGNALGTPESLMDSARSLTAHMALIIAADFDSPEFRVIFIAGLMLYLSTVILTLCIRALSRIGKGAG